jgi:hypothetical protein
MAQQPFDAGDIVLVIVCAAFQRQRATEFACPEAAGYNCRW